MVFGLVFTSCSKEDVIIPITSENTKPSMADDGWPIFVHTFFDGTGPNKLFGCAGEPADCLFTYEVNGNEAADIGGIIPQLDGSGSGSSVANIVQSNYEDLNIFIRVQVLEKIIDLEYYLEVKSEGNMHYFIITDAVSSEIIQVNPLKTS